MSPWPSGLAWYTKRWPLGAQFGNQTPGPKEVSCIGFDPSSSEIQISSGPDLEDLNAIAFPSGEYWAELSIRVEEIRGCGTEGGPFSDGISARQISGSKTV